MIMHSLLFVFFDSCFLFLPFTSLWYIRCCLLAFSLTLFLGSRSIWIHIYVFIHFGLPFGPLDIFVPSSCGKLYLRRFWSYFYFLGRSLVLFYLLIAPPFFQLWSFLYLFSNSSFGFCFGFIMSAPSHPSSVHGNLQSPSSIDITTTL